MERVLVVGASGHIGTGPQPSQRGKTIYNAGTKDGITVVEADVTSADGLQKVVNSVKKGDLPAFHHVYAAVGSWNPTSPFYSLEDEAFRQAMSTGVFSNFAAYKATVPYLIAQGYRDSTWTMITGAAGEHGSAGVTALTQGALYSMATVASRELAHTNVRFNEVYLNVRVDFDGDKSVRPKEFSQNYEQILQDKGIKGSRVSVLSKSDIANLKWTAKT